MWFTKVFEALGILGVVATGMILYGWLHYKEVSGKILLIVGIGLILLTASDIYGYSTTVEVILGCLGLFLIVGIGIAIVMFIAEWVQKD